MEELKWFSHETFYSHGRNNSRLKASACHRRLLGHGEMLAVTIMYTHYYKMVGLFLLSGGK